MKDGWKRHIKVNVKVNNLTQCNENAQLKYTMKKDFKKKKREKRRGLCWAITITSFLGSSYRPGLWHSHPFLAVCFLLHIFLALFSIP